MHWALMCQVLIGNITCDIQQQLKMLSLQYWHARSTALHFVKFSTIFMFIVFPLEQSPMTTLYDACAFMRVFWPLHIKYLNFKRGTKIDIMLISTKHISMRSKMK